MTNKLRKIRETLRLVFANPLVQILVGGLVTTVTTLLFGVFKTFSPRLKGFAHTRWLTLLGTVIVLLGGVGLFVFKKHFQRLYGVLEIGFALAVGWSGVARVQSTNDLASWTAVVAAAYLVVRGWSNYDEARSKYPTTGI